jgi:uncharacterized membrane protein
VVLVVVTAEVKVVVMAVIMAVAVVVVVGRVNAGELAMRVVDVGGQGLTRFPLIYNG